MATWEAYSVVFVSVLLNGGPVSALVKSMGRTDSLIIIGGFDIRLYFLLYRHVSNLLFARRICLDVGRQIQNLHDHLLILSARSPTSAAQYRWAAELAPKGYFRITSWIFGWITFWGWQLTTASPAFLAATIIQALAVINYPSYAPKPWHGTLIYWAITLMGFFVNVFGAKYLSMLEGFL